MNMRIEKVVNEPEDLELIAEGDTFEFVHGLPVEKPMGAESDAIAMELGTILLAFVRQQGLGRVFVGTTGFRCFPHDPKLLRKPDVAFVAKNRLPGGKPPKGDFRIAPDLAVEVVSPNDLCEELEEKIQDYRKAQIPLIWIVYPGSKIVLIRRADGSCAEVGATGELSGETVIPGFTCKVAELFV